MASSVVTFNVRTNRIRDIKIESGTTVGKFVSMVGAMGFDIKQARIEVLRRKEHDILIGDVLGYVLKDGDSVRFSTTDASLPNLEAYIDKLVNDVSKRREAKEKAIDSISRGRVINIEHDEEEDLDDEEEAEDLDEEDLDAEDTDYDDDACEEDEEDDDDGCAHCAHCRHHQEPADAGKILNASNVEIHTDNTGVHIHIKK